MMLPGVLERGCNLVETAILRVDGFTAGQSDVE